VTRRVVPLQSLYMESRFPLNPNEFPWRLSVQYLKGVGPKRAALFDRLGVKTIEDLLYFAPFRYEDRTAVKTISALCQGAVQTVSGRVESVKLIVTSRRSLKIVEAIVTDTTGSLHAKWFNQPYIKEVLKPGQRIMLTGKVTTSRYGTAYGTDRYLEISAPQYEIMDEEETQIDRDGIVPIYHETEGLTSRQIRSVMTQVLERYLTLLPEPLPVWMTERHRMVPLSQAIREIHFPPDGTDMNLLNEGKSPAHGRLSFDEFFFLEWGLALRKAAETHQEKGIAFIVSEEKVRQVKSLMPFRFTAAQERTWTDIQHDMASAYPMVRLIHGDVGSGKTLVALMAIAIAIENGYQAAMMVPTEILAEQHFLSLQPYMEKLGKSLALCTRQMKTGRNEGLARIESGEVGLVIGTHALIQESVQFKKLGLVVVDEQHKFGVMQRAHLIQKGCRPDLLMMTATPIPRTLALTLYGDIDISVIDELPPGRIPIQTILYYSNQRERAYQWMETELKKGRQAYIVYPLVEESEKMDLKAAMSMITLIQETLLPHRRVGLLHGRMKREEKEGVMRRFKEGAIDILVATTVVEVGVDVPNATVMVIEHAERFGLAQLHQLRGRVGRGREQSYCVMVAGYALSIEGRQRLNAMVKSCDGFKIAEIDLKIRGQGEFFGTRQSGFSPFKIANLLRDATILEVARKEAFDWVHQDPKQTQPESLLLRSFMEKRLGGTLESVTTG